MYAVLQQNVSTRWLLGVQPSKKIRTYLRITRLVIRREKETSAEYLYTTKVRKLVECRGREGTRDIVAQADIKRKFAEQTLAAAYMGRERKLAACRAEMQGRCGE